MNFLKLFLIIPSKYVKIIVSTSTPMNDTFLILKNVGSGNNLLKLEPMQYEDGRILLNLLLDDANRTLQPEQRNEILTKFKQTGLPLYLELAFKESKRWKSYTLTPDLDSSISGIIRQKFNRLSDDSNHGKIYS